MLERGAKVGGTWWFNTYPGCACDVPSHLYSFSFAPNPGLDAHLLQAARDRGLPAARRRGLRHRALRAAEHDRDRRRLGRGRAALARGDRPTGSVSARVLVSAAGALSDPKTPEIEGLDRFEGRMFHSAQWDHDLRRRPASASPSSAPAPPRSSSCPAIAPKVEQMHVFQRTAPWIMPHTDRPISPRERRLYRRFPLLQRLVRGGIYSASRAAGARLRQAAEADEARREARPQAHGPPDLRPRAAPQGRAGLHDRLQAHPAVEQVVSGARPRERRARHRRRRRGPRALDRDRRRRGGRGRRDHLRHRLQRHRHAGRPLRPRPRRAARSTSTGRAARGRTSARRSPASRTCSCCSAPTPGSGTARWST